ncbi:hypothetical protein Hanom_Chr01g00067141 [Helianthus anomalus]
MFLAIALISTSQPTRKCGRFSLLNGNWGLSTKVHHKNTMFKNYWIFKDNKTYLF